MNATTTIPTVAQRREHLIAAAHERRAQLVSGGVIGQPLPPRGPRSYRRHPRVVLALQAWLAAGQL